MYKRHRDDKLIAIRKGNKRSESVNHVRFYIPDQLDETTCESEIDLIKSRELLKFEEVKKMLEEK